MGVMYRLSHVTKTYGPVTALRDVSIEINAHEVVGIVGENGAGKSTLLKILSGSVTPDSGSIALRGQGIRFKGVSDAMKHGVAMVYQEQSLVPNLSVAENIFLGNEGRSIRAGVVFWRRLWAAARRELELIGSRVSPRAQTESLSFSRRQMIEVAKALATGTRNDEEPVVLLDEPTSVLEPGDIQQLFDVIRRLKEQAAVVFVSHRIDEVLGICDRIYVMRDGEVVGEVRPGELEIQDLYRLMVGRDVMTDYFHEGKTTRAGGSAGVKVEGLSGEGFEDVSFEIRMGEIVSLLGVQESGRESVGKALFGAVPVSRGTVSLEGAPALYKLPADAVAANVGYVPSERKVDGAVLDMSVADNMTLAYPRMVSSAGFVDRSRANALVESWIERLRIKVPGPQTPMRSLSGGNQQKVVLAKWLMNENLRFLILDTPTRGLDVGAKSDVYELMWSLSEQGVCVLLIADSLEEAIYMSHRIITMKDGAITGEFLSHPTQRPTREELLERMV